MFLLTPNLWKSFEFNPVGVIYNKVKQKNEEKNFGIFKLTLFFIGVYQPEKNVLFERY